MINKRSFLLAVILALACQLGASATDAVAENKPARSGEESVSASPEKIEPSGVERGSVDGVPAPQGSPQSTPTDSSPGSDSSKAGISELGLGKPDERDSAILTIFADGSRQMKYPKGTTVQDQPGGQRTVTRPVGSRTIEEKTGKVIIEYSDGSKDIYFPDGRFGSSYLDGSLVLRHPDGRRVTAYPDGRLVTRYRNGMVITQHSDGMRVIVYPDGRVVAEQGQRQAP